MRGRREGRRCGWWVGWLVDWLGGLWKSVEEVDCGPAVRADQERGDADSADDGSASAELVFEEGLLESDSDVLDQCLFVVLLVL